MISKNSRPLKLYNGSQSFECVCSCYVCMIVFDTVKWIISKSKRLLQMLMIYKIHFRIYIATNIWPAYRTFSFATMSRYYNFKWINIQAYFQSSLLHCIIWIIWSPLLFESYKLYDYDNVESVWTSENRILTTGNPIFRWRKPIKFMIYYWYMEKLHTRCTRRWSRIFICKWVYIYCEICCSRPKIVNQPKLSARKRRKI